jgi:anti-sigma factor RsiW
MLNETQAEAALYAETALVRHGMCAGRLDDAAALEVEVHLATHPAVGAGGADLA